jgi:hypothetical protein
MRALKAIITLPILTLAAACEPAATSVTGPDTRVVGASKHRGGTEDGAKMSASSSRSGPLHVTKECSAYTGLAGSFCTITSSNLKWIEVGSRVFYAKAAGATSLDSDVILDPPGRGNNIAFGHCALDFATLEGLCTFSGGTGKFRRFQASAAVSYLGGPNWACDGTYSFGGKAAKGHDAKGDDDDEDED